MFLKRITLAALTALTTHAGATLENYTSRDTAEGFSPGNEMLIVAASDSGFGISTEASTVFLEMDDLVNPKMLFTHGQLGRLETLPLWSSGQYTVIFDGARIQAYLCDRSVGSCLEDDPANVIMLEGNQASLLAILGASPISVNNYYLTQQGDLVYTDYDSLGDDIGITVYMNSNGEHLYTAGYSGDFIILRALSVGNKILTLGLQTPVGDGPISFGVDLLDKDSGNFSRRTVDVDIQNTFAAIGNMEGVSQESFIVSTSSFNGSHLSYLAYSDGHFYPATCELNLAGTADSDAVIPCLNHVMYENFGAIQEVFTGFFSQDLDVEFQPTTMPSIQLSENRIMVTGFDVSGVFSGYLARLDDSPMPRWEKISGGEGSTTPFIDFVPYKISQKGKIFGYLKETAADIWKIRVLEPVEQEEQVDIVASIEGDVVKGPKFINKEKDKYQVVAGNPIDLSFSANVDFEYQVNWFLRSAKNESNLIQRFSSNTELTIPTEGLSGETMIIVIKAREPGEKWFAKQKLVLKF